MPVGASMGTSELAVAGLVGSGSPWISPPIGLGEDDCPVVVRLCYRSDNSLRDCVDPAGESVVFKLYCTLRGLSL